MGSCCDIEIELPVEVEIYFGEVLRKVWILRSAQIEVSSKHAVMCPIVNIQFD